MKFVLIEFCGYILKTRVTRNRVTGIRVTRGLAYAYFSIPKLA